MIHVREMDLSQARRILARERWLLSLAETAGDRRTAARRRGRVALLTDRITELEARRAYRV